MNKCNTFYISRIKYLGRIIAFFHILKNHRSGKVIHFFLDACWFLFTGYSKRLGWYYYKYLLFKIENPFQVNSILEIFDFKIYDLPIKKSKPVIVDIGGFIGDSAIFFINKYPNATIYVFEPNEIIFPLLQVNLSHNVLNKSRIYLFNKAVIGNALGNHDRLYYSKSLLSNASLYSEHLAVKDKVYKKQIKVISFNELLSQINQIDLLKIDAEGSEYDIMPLIAQNFHRIKAFVIEIHYSNKMPDKLKKLYRLLNILSQKYRLVINPTYYQYRSYKTMAFNWKEFYTHKKNIYTGFTLYGMLE